MKRLSFGRSSEKLDPDQLALALEDLEQKIAEVQAEAEKTAPDAVNDKRTRDRRNGRPSLPDTLPEVHVTIEPDLSACPCCSGALHRIGEDTSRRLDVIPVQYRQLVTQRPKYACRACEGTILQAPAPERLIPGGLPTEALGASVVVGILQPFSRQNHAAPVPGQQLQSVLPLRSEDEDVAAIGIGRQGFDHERRKPIDAAPEVDRPGSHDHLELGAKWDHPLARTAVSTARSADAVTRATTPVVQKTDAHPMAPRHRSHVGPRLQALGRILVFSSGAQRRRRWAPVITSTRRRRSSRIAPCAPC